MDISDLEERLINCSEIYKYFIIIGTAILKLPFVHAIYARLRSDQPSKYIPITTSIEYLNKTINQKHH